MAADKVPRPVLFGDQGKQLVRYDVPCPDCGGDLVDLEPDAELGSRPVRYECHECALRFENDPAGGVREVDD